jgi:protein SCO1/2
LALLGLSSLAGCGFLGGGEPSSLDVPAESTASFDELPSVELVDTRGEAVSPARLRGSAWALAVLARPLRFQSRAQAEALSDLATAIAGTDLRLVSLSVDPLEDTPAMLAGYAEKVGADGDTWMLWTGKEPEIYRLLQAAFRSSLVGVDVQDMASFMERAFEPNVVVIDAEGRVRGTYDLFDEDGPAAILARLRAVARE